MAKARKRKGYFYEEQEQAVKDYLKAETKEEKDKIYNEWLKPAFTKMVESIIRRYKLFPPDEEFQETFNDTISFLMTKIEKFNPDMNYKAYSYCGTICKNYLIYRINQYNKNLKNNERYDAAEAGFIDSIEYSYYDKTSEDTTIANEFINGAIKKIEKTISNKKNPAINEDDVKVGNALTYLMTHWEDMMGQMGSNKFNKSSILLYIRETTSLNSKQVRESMKKFKNLYFQMKEDVLNE